ncbi:MAG: oligoendopeptidase F [Candidatus Zixiibacteriota bacterium]
MPVHAKPAAQPKRDEIDQQYTWNLADIYASESSWEADFKRARQMVDNAKLFAGRLRESPSVLYDCLEIRSELGMLLFNLYQYAFLNKDLDNRVSKYQAMTERAAMLSAEASTALAFVEPELLQIPEAELLRMAAQFSKTDVYDFYIAELIRSKAHVRSHEVEELLAMASTVSRGPDTIFSMLDDADLTYPVITDEHGNEVQLTKQRFAKLLESSDQRVRRDTSDGFYSSYKAHLNTIAATLAASVNKDVFVTRARRYDSCLHRALDGDNIPASVYHSLLDSTEANLAALHDYVTLRKRILRLDTIRPYDMFCPLFPEYDYEVPYDDAVRQVLEAVKPLGTEYQQAMSHAFTTRWVDVFETEGKGSGAYNYGNYSVHPFVLMNYNDTVDNMFTLAHEMGHAMHSHLSNRTQPYAKSQYSIFVAEVASTLNEGLLLHYLLEKTTDKRARLYLLNRHLDNTLGTFFHQVMYARFELVIHEQVESGNALSPEYLNQVWGKLTEQYYGPIMELDEHSKLKWSRVPHFYNMYYVYQYATSYAASQAIMAMFLTGEAGIIKRYLELLSSGGKDHPIELLKKCGVDMSSPKPVLATIDLFRDQVKQMDSLV